MRKLVVQTARLRLGPVTLDLAGGAYAAVLGPAGAGKTLLLRALAGLARHDGTALIDGRPERIGGALAYLACGGAPPPFRRVEDCLEFAQAARGTDRARRRQARTDLLAEWGLDGAADPARLGGEQRVRLRLASALASQPRLLLLDDPLSDCAEIGALLDPLRAIARRDGITVVHATPRRAEAFALASGLILLERGRVLQHGEVAALYERPDSLFIARRLGEVNELEGRIERIEDDIATIRLDCGPVIEADPPAQGAGPGDACLVLLRPGRISVSPLSPAELGGSAIAALLREVTPMGETIRLTLAIGADATLTVARPAAIGVRGLTVGNTVSVAWQSRHALVLPFSR